MICCEPVRGRARRVWRVQAAAVPSALVCKTDLGECKADLGECQTNLGERKTDLGESRFAWMSAWSVLGAYPVKATTATVLEATG